MLRAVEHERRSGVDGHCARAGGGVNFLTGVQRECVEALGPAVVADEEFDLVVDVAVECDSFVDMWHSVEKHVSAARSKNAPGAESRRAHDGYLAPCFAWRQSAANHHGCGVHQFVFSCPVPTNAVPPKKSARIDFSSRAARTTT